MILIMISNVTTIVKAENNDFTIVHGVLTEYHGTAKAVIIPNSVVSIGDSAFNNCKKMTSIKIPNTVKRIGDFAFKRCENLKRITIPKSVKSIGKSAFSDCKNLISITLPDTVTSIGRYALKTGNDKLVLICNESTYAYSYGKLNHIIINLNDSTENNTLYVNFETGASANCEASDGWSNGDEFDCTWRMSNITYENSVMKLAIDKDIATSSTPYSAAECQTLEFYGYGKYEVSMKPIKNDGVVSSFFTYTGPSDNNPWDEIDIEFVGKDTTKVEFNYYTNGVGLHEYSYYLGYDASEEFHTYGFDWEKGSITWYVDGKAVYTATENIPVTPGRAMMNVWPGIGVDSWLNAFDGTVPLHAEYKWFKITESK